jgi:ABC-type uncharacterized transport system ATPase subunit
VTPPSTNGREPYLAVRELDASYGPVQILFGLDLDVYEGEIVALLGTNGAGKSTLFKCITNLLEPTSGTITFAGDDITGMATEDIATGGIVMMPGGRSIFPTLTVRDNLRLACWTKRHDRAAVQEAEERVLSLFPRSANELAMTCTCPDWSVPCKHVAATLYLLAEAFDRDPFLILSWRGRDKAELLANLRRPPAATPTPVPATTAV